MLLQVLPPVMSPTSKLGLVPTNIEFSSRKLNKTIDSKNASNVLFSSGLSSMNENSSQMSDLQNVYDKFQKIGSLLEKKANKKNL